MDKKKLYQLILEMAKEKMPEEDLEKGIETEEEEHKLGPEMSEKIASDHLEEDPEAYEESDEVCEECGEEKEDCLCENPLKDLIMKHKGEDQSSYSFVNPSKKSKGSKAKR